MEDVREDGWEERETGRKRNGVKTGNMRVEDITKPLENIFESFE